jgi:hypothetical protein
MSFFVSFFFFFKKKKEVNKQLLFKMNPTF